MAACLSTLDNFPSYVACGMYVPKVQKGVAGEYFWRG
jgi:hypothetical protein